MHERLHICEEGKILNNAILDREAVLIGSVEFFQKVDVTETLRCAVLLVVLSLAVIDDCRRFRISNRIIVAGVGLSGVIAMIDCVAYGNVNRGADMLIGGVAGFFTAFIIYAFRGIGAGDVKLLMVCGMLMGQGNVLMMIAASMVAGLAMGLLEMLTESGKRGAVGSLSIHLTHFSLGIFVGNVFVMAMKGGIW